MSILSTYAFPFGFFNGTFSGTSVSKTQQQVSNLMIGLNGSGSIVRARRPDAEVTQVVSPLFNTTETLGEIGQTLLPINQEGDVLVTQTSPIMAQGVLYSSVPYFLSHPLRHPRLPRYFASTLRCTSARLGP